MSEEMGEKEKLQQELRDLIIRDFATKHSLPVTDVIDLLKEIPELNVQRMDQLLLDLNWDKAKALQLAIAIVRHHVKEDSSILKDLNEIEEKLESFTGTASVFVVPEKTGET